jgi:hypothetical protein
MKRENKKQIKLLAFFVLFIALCFCCYKLGKAQEIKARRQHIRNIAHAQEMDSKLKAEQRKQLSTSKRLAHDVKYFINHF